MATASAPPQPPLTTQPLSPTAGFLSYLVPGLGQIVQGRVGKGLLFGVCIYTLFFYGLFLGTGSVTVDGETYRLTSNVYLPDTAEEPRDALSRLATNLYNRPQFAGQFWVGVVAWPAVWQYMHFQKGVERHPFLGTFMREPNEASINAVQNASDKRLELGWVYTVIAGVLNIMVIYDAVAGPAFVLGGAKKED
jgi:hypothetical protein